MTLRTTQRFCPTCGRPTLHGREMFGDGWGCLLTLLTGGLFLPLWLILIVVQTCTPYRCQTCGG